jgi:predicted dithiol-disulfide oxidoreductase (DUF899 family)
MGPPSLKYADATAKLADYRRQIAGIREKMRATQSAIEPQEVRDYEFLTPQGAVLLSELFGDHDDLIVIHNMGSSCPYCTLWADGYMGIHHHLLTRAGFAMSTPDAPDVQQKFADSRGWKFRMVSHKETTFAADMGYRSPKGGCLPGISVFRRSGEKIVRVSDTELGPGDDFCAVWHMLDLFPEGAAGWSPKLRYPE